MAESTRELTLSNLYQQGEEEMRAISNRRDSLMWFRNAAKSQLSLGCTFGTALAAVDWVAGKGQFQWLLDNWITEYFYRKKSGS